MKMWISQKREVDHLAADAGAQARQTLRAGRHLKRRAAEALKDPGTLAWSFAAGAWLGIAARPGSDPSRVRRALTALLDTQLTWRAMTRLSG